MSKRKIIIISLIVLALVVVLVCLCFIFESKKSEINDQKTGINNQNTEQKNNVADNNDTKKDKCALVRLLSDGKYETVTAQPFYYQNNSQWEPVCFSAAARYTNDLSKEYQDWLFYSEDEKLVDSKGVAQTDHKIFAYNFLTHEKKLVFDLQKEDAKLLGQDLGSPVIYLAKGKVFVSFIGYMSKGAIFCADLPPAEIKFKKIYEGMSPQIVEYANRFYILSGMADAGMANYNLKLLVWKVATSGFDIEVGPDFALQSASTDGFVKGVFQVSLNPKSLSGTAENLWFFNYNSKKDSVDSIFVWDPYKGLTSSIFSKDNANNNYFIEGDIPDGIVDVKMANNILYMQGKGHYYSYDFSDKNSVMKKNVGQIPESAINTETFLTEEETIRKDNAWCMYSCNLVESTSINKLQLPPGYAYTVLDN